MGRYSKTAFVRPFYPNRYKRSDRYLAGGRLRPLDEVVLSNQFRSLAVRWTYKRPLGSHGINWMPQWRDIAYRSGYQKRRRDEIFAAEKALRARKRMTQRAGRN